MGWDPSRRLVYRGDLEIAVMPRPLLVCGLFIMRDSGSALSSAVVRWLAEEYEAGVDNRCSDANTRQLFLRAVCLFNKWHPSSLGKKLEKVPWCWRVSTGFLFMNVR